MPVEMPENPVLPELMPGYARDWPTPLLDQIIEDATQPDVPGFVLGAAAIALVEKSDRGLPLGEAGTLVTRSLLTRGICGENLKRVVYGKSKPGIDTEARKIAISILVATEIRRGKSKTAAMDTVSAKWPLGLTAVKDAMSGQSRSKRLELLSSMEKSGVDPEQFAQDIKNMKRKAFDSLIDQYLNWKAETSRT